MAALLKSVNHILNYLYSQSGFVMKSCTSLEQEKFNFSREKKGEITEINAPVRDQQRIVKRITENNLLHT